MTAAAEWTVVAGVAAQIGVGTPMCSVHDEHGKVLADCIPAAAAGRIVAAHNNSRSVAVIDADSTPKTSIAKLVTDARQKLSGVIGRLDLAIDAMSRGDTTAGLVDAAHALSAAKGIETIFRAALDAEKVTAPDDDGSGALDMAPLIRPSQPGDPPDAEADNTKWIFVCGAKGRLLACNEEWLTGLEVKNWPLFARHYRIPVTPIPEPFRPGSTTPRIEIVVPGKAPKRGKSL